MYPGRRKIREVEDWYTYLKRRRWTYKTLFACLKWDLEGELGTQSNFQGSTPWLLPIYLDDGYQDGNFYCLVIK